MSAACALRNSDPAAAEASRATAAAERAISYTRCDSYELRVIRKICRHFGLHYPELQRARASIPDRQAAFRFKAFDLLEDAPEVQFITADVLVRQIGISDLVKRFHKLPPVAELLRGREERWLAADRPAALVFNWPGHDPFMTVHDVPTKYVPYHEVREDGSIVNRPARIESPMGGRVLVMEPLDVLLKDPLACRTRSSASASEDASSRRRDASKARHARVSVSPGPRTLAGEEAAGRRAEPVDAGKASIAPVVSLRGTGSPEWPPGAPKAHQAAAGAPHGQTRVDDQARGPDDRPGGAAHGEACAASRAGVAAVPVSQGADGSAGCPPHLLLEEETDFPGDGEGASPEPAANPLRRLEDRRADPKFAGPLSEAKRDKNEEQTKVCEGTPVSRCRPATGSSPKNGRKSNAGKGKGQNRRLHTSKSVSPAPCAPDPDATCTTPESEPSRAHSELELARIQHGGALPADHVIHRFLDIDMTYWGQAQLLALGGHLGLRAKDLPDLFERPGEGRRNLELAYALADLEAKRRGLISELAAAGWGRLADKTKLAYVLNCPPSPGVMRLKRQPCELRGVCPFCFGKSVAERWGAVDAAVFPDGGKRVKGRAFDVRICSNFMSFGPAVGPAEVVRRVQEHFRLDDGRLMRRDDVAGLLTRINPSPRPAGPGVQVDVVQVALVERGMRPSDELWRNAADILGRAGLEVLHGKTSAWAPRSFSRRDLLVTMATRLQHPRSWFEVSAPACVALLEACGVHRRLTTTRGCLYNAAGA